MTFMLYLFNNFIHLIDKFNFTESKIETFYIIKCVQWCTTHFKYIVLFISILTYTWSISWNMKIWYFISCSSWKKSIGIMEKWFFIKIYLDFVKQFPLENFRKKNFSLLDIYLFFNPVLLTKANWTKFEKSNIQVSLKLRNHSTKMFIVKIASLKINFIIHLLT